MGMICSKGSGVTGVQAIPFELIRIYPDAFDRSCEYLKRIPEHFVGRIII